MRYGIAVVAALLLIGCSTVRYVKVPCLSPSQLQQRKDAEPPKVGDKLTGQAQEDLKTIAGSAVQLRAWGQGNLLILQGCTG